VAVYATAADETIAARESGFEGVACVDDAARLLGVLSRVWTRTALEPIRGWALGLLEFVLWMQEPDGRWVNFVEDWAGTRNETGLTSSVGENFWHGRAMCALCLAWLNFGDERAEAGMRRGFARVQGSEAPADVRALHLELGLRLIAEAGQADLDGTVRRWAHEIAERREGDVLMNNPDERGAPHLWAHVQEGVLADAGALLGDTSLIDRARGSAHALLEPVVRDGFDRPSMTPYDVSSAVFSLDRLGVATDEARWGELAVAAREWFDGRNPSGSPVYDRERGRVGDGIDDGRVSRNSGAEANIEAAAALFDDAVASATLIEPLLPHR
jgi:hypothetical protein